MSTLTEIVDFSRTSSGYYLDSVTYGEELITNGDFRDGTNNWTAAHVGPDGGLSVVDGYLRVTDDGSVDEAPNNTYSGRAYQVLQLEVGARYIVTGTTRASSTAITRISASTSASISHNIKLDTGSSSSNDVDLQFAFKATQQNTTIILYLSGSNANHAEFKNISCKKIIEGQAGGEPLMLQAPANTPRLEYDAQGNPLGLLIEEQRQNMFQRSIDFNNAYWTKDETIATGREIVAPAGNRNAQLITSQSAENGGVSKTVTTVQGTVYCVSFFAKYNNNKWFRLSVNGRYQWYDIINGKLGSASKGDASYADPVHVGIDDYGNGWYRCYLAVDALSTSFAAQVVQAAGDGSTAETNGGKTYLWAAQMEVGEFPTSFIYTLSSTATRTSDIAKIPTERFYLDQNNGTFIAEFQGRYETFSTNYQRIYELGNVNSTVNRLTSILRTSDGHVTSQLYQNNVTGNTVEALGTQEALPNNFPHQKVAQTYKVNHHQNAGNGMASGIDTSVEMSATRDLLSLMQNYNGNGGDQKLNGHIKRIRYIPKLFTTAELELVTTPSTTPNLSLTFDGQSNSVLTEGLHD